jgi:tRNA (guanine37-N1)-methyltransferase
MAEDTFRAYDRFGNIALVKFPERARESTKKRFAKKILEEHKSVTTVLEKVGKFKGRLRKQETKWLAGEKTKEVKYTENGCVFRFNIDDTYFSPRLSNERKEIAEKIKKSDIVLVMFAGVAPFPIVIAKNSMAKRVYSNELNRAANKYTKLNIELNKLKHRVFLIPGDIKKVAKKIKRGITGTLIPLHFDVIVMPRPQLDDTFLHEAFMLSKKGTRIFYYDFCEEGGMKSVITKIKSEALKSKKKIKILGKKKAGEIGPYKYRVRVDIRVLGSA